MTPAHAGVAAGIQAIRSKGFALRTIRMSATQGAKLNFSAPRDVTE
jgi:hypothetical protein